MTSFQESTLTTEIQSPVGKSVAEAESGSSCNKEPVRLIGTIQPHAFFLAFQERDLRLQIVSENVGQSVLCSSPNPLGLRLSDLIGGATLEHAFFEAQRSEYWQQQQHSYFVWTQKSLDFEVHCFSSGGLICLELEPLAPEGFDIFTPALSSQAESHYLLSATLKQMKLSESLDDLGKAACKAVRALTGLDRVMLYRFLPPNDHGQVIAEDKVAQAHTFLHHRFPSSDIPKPARDLYLQNQTRFIGDSHAVAVPLHPQENPLTNEIFDLSESRTRGVSAIHLEYLRNMGVRTSFSIAIVVQGQLWGLIACHSAKKVYVGQRARGICQSISETLATAAPLLENIAEERRRSHFNASLFEYFYELRRSHTPIDQLFRKHAHFLQTFRAQGVAYVSSHRIDFVGLTPTKRDLAELTLWLRERLKVTQQGILAIDNLSAMDPKWETMREQVSGVLAALLPSDDDAVFMVFRPELISRVVWGGDPRKLDTRNYRGSINPRKSFEGWEETVRSHSMSWTASEIEGMKYMKDFVLDSLMEEKVHS